MYVYVKHTVRILNWIGKKSEVFGMGIPRIKKRYCIVKQVRVSYIKV